MANSKDASESERRTWRGMQGGGPSGAVYCLGLIGALVYYIQQADTFWAGVVGILKALVWPAFLIYELLRFLNM